MNDVDSAVPLRTTLKLLSRNQKSRAEVSVNRAAEERYVTISAQIQDAEVSSVWAEHTVWADNGNFSLISPSADRC